MVNGNDQSLHANAEQAAQCLALLWMSNCVSFKWILPSDFQLGHRVRTDIKWECYQTYPRKGNIDVWSCWLGGGIECFREEKKNSFRCECAIFYTACLCQFICFMPAYIKRQKLWFEGCNSSQTFVSSSEWLSETHTAMNCLFGNGCDSVGTLSTVTGQGLKEQLYVFRSQSLCSHIMPHFDGVQFIHLFKRCKRLVF